MTENKIQSTRIILKQILKQKGVLMERYMGSKELMEAFRISRTTLYRMEQEGLPFLLIGKTKRYDTEEVRSWLESRQRGIESLVIGETYSNDFISKVFKCENMGGMRRSHTTNTLVIFSDHTKMYDDKWDADILHYTGMGKKGDQDIHSAQNKTLNESKINGVKVYLFETFVEGDHIFMGQVELCGEPYQEQQDDEDGYPRKVWMFPLRLVGKGYIVPETIIHENNREKEDKAKRLSDTELKERAKKANRFGKRTTISQTFERDPYVMEYAKRRAAGVCDLCDEPAPFRDKLGRPYLETHHVVWLSKGGEDSIRNTVAVCPNCHRRLHSLNSLEDVNKLNGKLAKYNRE